MKSLTPYQKNKIKSIAKSTIIKLKKSNSIWYMLQFEGACAITAGWVLDELEKINIKAKAIINYHKEEGYHAFVLVNDEYILDLTYWQFNDQHKSFAFLKKEKKHEYHKGCWFWNLKGKAIAHNKHELIKIQKKQKWDEDQLAC